MGSTRLTEIQAAIQRLTDAQVAGSAAEIAAAQALLNTPLSPDLTPPQILKAGKARLDRFEEVVQHQADIGNWAEVATAGIATAAANLEGPDRLGIPAAEIDAEIDRALGIAGQAAKGLFIDPETGIVVRGARVGELTPAMIRLADVLKPDEKISPADIAERLGIKPSSASHLLGRTREASGDSLIELAGKGRYRRNPALTILGEKLSAPPVVVSVEEGGSPATYSMKQILQQEEVAGVLSEPQVRHLIRGLVASGHFQVGKHVVETNPQPRGKAKEMVWDLEVTPVGLEILGFVAEKFGARGKIYVNSVVQELNQQRTAPAAQPADEGQRFWGAQLVAGLKHVGTGALNTLQQAGILEPDKHFMVTPSGKRVYLPPAKTIVEKLDAAAATAPIGRITREFVSKTFGPPKEERSTEPAAWENPYGPNGPSVLTTEHERLLLNRLQLCELGIERRLGKPLNPEFKLERDSRLGELTNRLAEDESLRIDSDVQQRIRQEAAATVLELARDARKFNFVRHQHPGLELTLLVVKALDKKSVGELAEAMVNPPRQVADVIERNGVVNGIRVVGPLV